jgi:hypothetical protein
MWVEKIDLKSLFSDICKRYTIPLINIRGRNVPQQPRWHHAAILAARAPG